MPASMFAKCLCFSLILGITAISPTLRADGVSRGFTSTQTTATGGGGGSLDSTLNDTGEAKAQATGISRGFTSTQTVATGGGKGSLDNQLGPVKPKTKVFIPPTRVTKSKTVKDDRKVVATKEAYASENLVVRTLLPTKLTATSNIVKPPLSNPKLGTSAFVQTATSPVQHALQ
ncbi:MAG: hypothetical protein JWM68_1442 [Verrucomicrobiales bacterium]|nr:hypothetical protein [Verrucomicrobiales bacterium]